MESFHHLNQKPITQVTAPPLMSASHLNNSPSLPPFPIPASSMMSNGGISTAAGMNNHGCPPYQQQSMPPLPIPFMSSLTNGNQLLHQQDNVEIVANGDFATSAIGQQDVTSNYAKPDVEEIIEDRDVEPVEPFYNDQSELNDGQQPPECNAPMYDMVESSEDATMTNSSVNAVAAAGHNDCPSVTPVEHTVVGEESVYEESLEEAAATADVEDHSIQHVEQDNDLSIEETKVSSVDGQYAEQSTFDDNVEQETMDNESGDKPLNYPLIEEPETVTEDCKEIVENDTETCEMVEDDCCVAQEDEVCESVMEAKEPYVEEPSEDDPIGDESGTKEVICEEVKEEEKEMEQTKQETEPKEVLPIVEDVTEIVEESIEQPIENVVVGGEEEIEEKLNSEVIVDEVINNTAENKDEEESPTPVEEIDNSDSADVKTTPKRKAKSDSPSAVSSKKRVTMSPLPPAAVKQSVESPSGRLQRNRTPVTSPKKDDDSTKLSKSPPTKKTPASILKKSKVEKVTDEKEQTKVEKDGEHTSVTDTVTCTPPKAKAEGPVSRTSRSRSRPKPGNMPERKSSREPTTKATSAKSTSPSPKRNIRASKAESVAKPTVQSKSRSQSSSTKSRSPARGKQVAVEETKVTKTAAKNESAPTKKRGRSAVTATRTAAVTEEAPKVREGSRRSSRKAAALDAENSIAETLAPSAKRSKRS